MDRRWLGGGNALDAVARPLLRVLAGMVLGVVLIYLLRSALWSMFSSLPQPLMAVAVLGMLASQFLIG